MVLAALSVAHSGFQEENLASSVGFVFNFKHII